MLKKATHCLTILILVFAIVADVFAGGGKRNGTAGAQELLIPVTARGLAISGAYSAGMVGIDAIYYNPAGLGSMRNSVDAMFSYMNYIADIGQTFTAIGVSFEGFGNLGLSIRSMDFGDIPITTEQSPYGTGTTFSPTYVVLGVTYANALTDRIRVGVNFNFISEEIMSTSASGIAFDAGVQYSGVGGLEGLEFGVVIKNLGPKMSYEGADLLRLANENENSSSRGTQFYTIDASAFELPSQLEIGVAYQTRFSDEYNAIFATSFQSNNFSNDEIKLSGEFNYDDMVYLRGGYTYVSEVSDSEDQYLFGPTFGVGLNVDAGIEMVFDYGYRWARYFDANHMITITLGF
jgi:hypothetical protein